MSKKLSPAAIVALKEALCNIYWYKSDLRSFLQQCISDGLLVGSLNWDNYKRQIVSDLIDTLVADQERYLGDLTSLSYAVVNIGSFEHLAHLDRGEQKIKRATSTVEQLRKLVEPHKDALLEEEAIVKRQAQLREKLKTNIAVREKLSDLYQRFTKLATSEEVHTRGYELETLMYDLFELFDLDPKASFKNVGEQIDGAFTLEGTDYLFEAKWQKDPVAIQDLDGFSSKVRRKLENTLGVFLSMNGYSEDAVRAHSTGQPSIVLMDGPDLMAVLEERIDFVSLLLRKKRHASQTGSIYLRIHEIL